MRGDYVKLVEHIVTETLQDIEDAVENIFVAIKDIYGGDSSEEFLANVQRGMDKEVVDLPPFFTFVKGKFRGNTGEILNATKVPEQDFIINYNNQKDVYQVVKRIYGNILENISNFVEDIAQNADQELAKQLENAMIREIIVAFLSKIKINSRIVNEEQIRSIVRNAIKKIA